MSINASDVKLLRERTGAGMMDCKKALVETNGDIDAAVDFLREKGLAAAVKKSGRIAAEGVVGGFISADAKSGAIAEINCETDFVAKTPEFQAFAKDVANQAQLADADASVEAILEQPFCVDPSTTIKDVITEKVATIGENISFRRFVKMAVDGQGVVEAYIHMGGKIGVIINLGCEKAETAANAEFKTVARDLAMHIAATNPMYVSTDNVDPEVIEKERVILRAQALEEGKPENIVDKMVEGRIHKYEKEICLLEQPFVKDTDISVATLLEQKGKQFGDNIKVNAFVRYEMGEGLQKREDDFVAEVMRQAGNQ